MTVTWQDGDFLVQQSLWGGEKITCSSHSWPAWVFFNSLKVFEPRVMECGVVIVARTVAIGLGMVNDVVTHFFLRQKISSLLKSNSTFIDYII